MFKRKKFTNAFLQASKEHQIYMNLIGELKTLIDGGAHPQLGNMHILKDKLKSFKDDLCEHFQLEEQVLFPAGLLGISDLETADQILQLTGEHGAFERDLLTLNQIVECHPDNDPNIPGHTLDVLSNFVENLEAHAKGEMEELFPRIIVIHSLPT